MAKITVTIESSDEVILRVSRFLAWMHYCSHWGHSGTVALDIDGDGNDKVTVAGIDLEPHREYVNRVCRRWPREKQVEYISSAQIKQ